MVEVGFVEDPVSRTYDVLNLLMIITNITISIALTFDEVRAVYADVLLAIESVTIAFFALDYLLRIWTADRLYPDLPGSRAVLKYVVSISGLVDLLSFLPFYMPDVLPGGTAVFRIFRVMRIFKLFRIGAYSDSFSVISAVIYKKRQQLITSLFIILVLMTGASLCMYSAEHVAQPEVFRNALSGLWWAGSTLLTVGYGDIYPVTVLGKTMGTLIAFLGVGAVAIPTGIISAGFIEQYNEIREAGEYHHPGLNKQTVRIRLSESDEWTGREIDSISVPKDMIISEVLRDGTNIKKDKAGKLRSGDILTIRIVYLEDCI